MRLNSPIFEVFGENSKKLKDSKTLSQHNIFHSVLDFLEIESPIYDENMSIFK